MKPLPWICHLALGCCCLASLNGCVTLGDSAGNTAAEVAPTEAPLPSDPIAAWRAANPETAAIKCSIARNVAPDSVKRFYQLASGIERLYSEVHDDAVAIESAIACGDLTKDALFATLTSQGTGEVTAWRSAAQEVTRLRFQAILDEATALRKQTALYIDGLQKDEAIVNLPNRTEVLVALGKDAVRLDTRLQTIIAGATAVRKCRVAAVLGK